MASKDGEAETSSGSFAFPDETIRRELARLIADQHFANSPTLIRFLEYTVAEALAGRGDRLKESLLGREVFDRGSEFDPRIDPIVRVQAGKLRAKLAEYYQSQGADDPIRVEFPKGGYSPHFLPRDSAGGEPRVTTVSEPALARRAPRWIGRWGKRATLPAAAVALAVAIAWAWLEVRIPPEPKITLTQLTFEAGSAMIPAISKDGKLLAYSSDRGRGDLNIWIRPVDGGTPVQLTRDEAADHSPDFSPDATLIAFRSYRNGGGIYTVSVFGAEERRVADNGWSPRFSPDGAWIAYLGTGNSLFVVPVGGGQPRKVAFDGIAALAGPVWTPDGTHLVFLGEPCLTDQTMHEYDWYSVAVRGGAPVAAGLREQLGAQKLPLPSTSTRPGDWLDNAIIFSLQRGKAANIWKVPVNPRSLRVAGPAVQLTAGTAAETFPRCSLTGRMVLTSESQLTHIFGLELDPKTGKATGPLRQLTSDSSLIPDHLYPRLSLDGTVLTYVSNRSGSQELMLKNTVSGSEASLGALPRQESLPLISGDRTLLVYGSAGGPQTVYAVDPAKPFVQRICDRCGQVFDWSRDGQAVLLEAASRRSLELWEPSGGRRHELIEYPAGTLVQATLAADRKWVAVLFSIPGGAFVVPVSAAAVPREKWIPIVAGWDLSSLHWSPDGGFLYFFSRLDDYRCLWALRLDPATRRPVGPPFSIQHFHTNRLAPWGSSISVGSGRIVLGLTEPRSNVWLATLGNRAPLR